MQCWRAARTCTDASTAGPAMNCPGEASSLLRTTDMKRGLKPLLSRLRCQQCAVASASDGDSQANLWEQTNLLSKLLCKPQLRLLTHSLCSFSLAHCLARLLAGTLYHSSMTCNTCCCNQCHAHCRVNLRNAASGCSARQVPAAAAATEDAACNR